MLFVLIIFAALYICMHVDLTSVVYTCVCACCLLQYYRKARSLALSRTHPELFKEEEGVNDDQVYSVTLFIEKSVGNSNVFFAFV